MKQVVYVTTYTPAADIVVTKICFVMIIAIIFIGLKEKGKVKNRHKKAGRY